MEKREKEIEDIEESVEEIEDIVGMPVLEIVSDAEQTMTDPTHSHCRTQATKVKKVMFG